VGGGTKTVKTEKKVLSIKGKKPVWNSKGRVDSKLLERNKRLARGRITGLRNKKAEPSIPGWNS